MNDIERAKAMLSGDYEELVVWGGAPDERAWFRHITEAELQTLVRGDEVWISPTSRSAAKVRVTHVNSRLCIRYDSNSTSEIPMDIARNCVWVRL